MPASTSSTRPSLLEAPATMSICGAVVGAIAQIAAGFIHELNNKLGPVLLNAELLASSRGEVPGAAADIVRNVSDMQEMLRDIEAILPRNLERDVPLEPTLHHVVRVVRGALRRRRLRLEVPELDDSCLMDSDPVTTVLTMLLVPFVFHGPEQGDLGVLEVQYRSTPESWAWRVEVSSASAPDPTVVRTLMRICARNEWRMATGSGWLTVDGIRQGG